MNDHDDRALFTTASKVFSFILIGVQASAYIIGGVYSLADPRMAIVVFLQLLFAGLILVLLDEMLQKGWGLGSGISLFILAGVAQGILWESLSIAPSLGKAPETVKSYGAIPALIQTLVQGQFTPQYLYGRPSNTNLPTILGLFTTLVVFFVVIYAEGVRVEMPISYAGYRGFRSRYPIKLMYVSNLPVIFASALFANIYFISQLIWSNLNRSNSNPWLNLIGMYTTSTEGGGPVPSGGLVYFVIPPRSIVDIISDPLGPLRAVVYTIILVAFSIIFSLTWLEVGGLGPSTVAKQLKDSGMEIPGFRRSEKPIEQVLKRYIPTVTILGGALVGFIAAVADFFGVFGTGMGVLLSVGILYQYYQLLMQERVAEMYPALRRFFGE